MLDIYIVRHAKSSWADLTMKDVDRPLNTRGIRDAPIMAEFLKSNNINVDTMLVSVAQRTQETSQYFKQSLLPKNYTIIQELYHAPASTYFEQMYGLDDDVTSVMMFGHNPGITYLANEVSDTFIDNVPTCGVLVLRSSAKSWQDVDIMNTKMINFYYPKNI